MTKRSSAISFVLILLISLAALGQKSDQPQVDPDPVPVYPANYKDHARAEGKGLIVPTCGALIGNAFSDLGLNRVQARFAAENVRSRAIPESLGCVQGGVIRQCERLHDRTIDLVIYGTLADEWKSRN